MLLRPCTCASVRPSETSVAWNLLISLSFFFLISDFDTRWYLIWWTWPGIFKVFKINMQYFWFSNILAISQKKKLRISWFLIVMRCSIWYHLYNLKNVKNTHDPWRSVTFSKVAVTKSNIPPWVFSHFLNCTNGTNCTALLPFVKIKQSFILMQNT